MVDGIEALSPCRRIHIPHPKRKYPHPIVHESPITLLDYQGARRSEASPAGVAGRVI